MRLWDVPCELLCRQHFLGLHRELHTMIQSVKKNKHHLLRGHIKLNQIDMTKILTKHDECVLEMEKRGYNHKSPMPEDSEEVIWAFIEMYGTGHVDQQYDLNDLASRCPVCRERILNMGLIVEVM